MELRRFFVDPSNITETNVVVCGDEFLHMTKVLRLKCGFKVIVCAGDGTERGCTIERIEKDCAILRVDDTKKIDRRKVSVTLFAGLLKNQKLDFTIQKAVELGIDRVVPFISANTSETKFNRERAEKIAVEAAKQCGSAFLTKVDDVLQFSDVLTAFARFDSVVFAYEKEKQNPIRTCAAEGNDIALIVGSEGGFKPEEFDDAVALGAKPVTLGRRILRAETAGIVASALLLDALGELDND